MAEFALFTFGQAFSRGQCEPWHGYVYYKLGRLLGNRTRPPQIKHKGAKLQNKNTQKNKYAKYSNTNTNMQNTQIQNK